MLVHLDLEPRLEHQLRDVSQQASRTDQADSLRLGLLDELLREGALRLTQGIRRRRQQRLHRRIRRRFYRRLIVITHCLSLRARPASGPACQASSVTPMI
jgi:hypothetical protein